MNKPNHIAIIMDGNGRWGKNNYNSRLRGHQDGIKNIKSILNYCLNEKIKNLTLYASSYDNLKKRNNKEIKNLYFLINKYLVENIYFFKKNKIKLKFIGEKNIPKKTRSIINNSEKETNIIGKNLNLVIAFNYSSKKEILNAFKKTIKKKQIVTEKNLSKNLYTSKFADPDILIRTGGFHRLSDFLLWQLSYTEFFFLDKLWPDFKVIDLRKIIKKYSSIKRNFGS